MGLAAAAAVVTIASTVLGTVASVRAQQQQSASDQAAANYRSQVAKNNQIIADRKAEDARQRGAIAERQQRIKTAQRIGAARASAAARGVEVDSGSAGDITSDLKALGELDALTIRNNAEREALGFEQTGTNYAAESNLASLESGSAKRAGEIGVASSLINGTGQVAGKWYEFSKTK